MSTNKAVPAIIGAVAVTVAVVGAVMVLRGRSGAKDDHGDEEAFSATKPASPKKIEKKPTPAPSATKTPVAAATPKAAAAVPKATVAAATTTAAPTAADDSDNLLDAALDEVVPKVAPAAAVVTTVAATSFEGTRTKIEHLGISVKVPSDWEVREELSPVPNVAMVTVWNPEFANMPNAEVPGAVPVIILSVEDIHGENLSLAEFKDRSKELSMQQMLMMTGGAIQPVVRRDAAIQEGCFRQLLEYAQSMPPFFDISVINLLEVRNGLAYVFQIMANPHVMAEYRSLFMQIARDIAVTPMENSSLGFLRVFTGKVSVDIDTTWNWTIPGDDSDASAALATFELTSTVKAERISLYETAKVPETDHKHRGAKEMDGAKMVSSFNGTQERKVFTYGGYALVVEPTQRAISFLPEAAVVLALKSAKACTDEARPRDGATFLTTEYGYKFDVVGTGRVVSTKLGKGTVVYAPLGIQQDMTKEMTPEDQGPTVTVRIGNPETDPDCMSTIEEWKTRIDAEAATSDLSNIKIVNLKGEKCLIFKSKEMQETGPGGEKTEIAGEVYIFVREGVTTLIRWEVARSQWRKFERDLSTFLESFRFL